jgi:hypothetical protein
MRDIPMPYAVDKRLGLTSGQSIALIAIGAALWFIAAIILRSIAPMGALEGTARAITYALVIPGTLPFVILTRVIVKLRQDQIAIGIAVVTATALLIDGIVVAWFPGVYSNEIRHVAACAAGILWGAGVGLLLGFILNEEAKI